MKILLTGFNAFGKLRTNPSELVVKRVSARVGRQGNRGFARRLQLISAILPTEYARASRELKRLIRSEKPRAILLLGVAPARTAIALERFALNLDDESVADNAGVVRRARPIVRDGPDLYRSTLPLERMLRALGALPIPSYISNHAGTYLCNHVFYAARHATAKSRPRVACGFVHLPLAKRSPARRKSRTAARISIRQMEEAIWRCLEVLAADRG